MFCPLSLSFSEEEKTDLHSLIASILWMGNLQVTRAQHFNICNLFGKWGPFIYFYELSLIYLFISVPLLILLFIYLFIYLFIFIHLFY